MNFIKFLNEMPMKSSYEDSDNIMALDDPEENEYEYESIQNIKPIATLNGLNLIFNKKDHNEMYYLVNPKNNSIEYKSVYYKGYNVHKIDFYVSSMIWKKRNSSIDPVKVFYDYILKNYKSVYSSGSHTDAGEKYWNNLVKEAFNRNYNVGIVDLKLGKNTEKSLKEISSIDEFNNIKGNIYGDNKTDKLIAIFK